ncbi:MAG TPA: ATP-binding protein, partial [Nitrososphaera sp.]|nr:ATP-binding protein [Nitrososphaera sp.]
NSNFAIEVRDDEIMRFLYQHNPWWTKKPIAESKIKPFKRRDYYKIVDRLADDKILALIGPRQVGKTTIVYQLIEKLLAEDGINAQNIFFLSLDDPYLNVSVQNLERIFELYATNILKRPIDELKEKGAERIYVFLDEIQSVDNWEVVLKRWYDLGYKMKFVITGSSSVSIVEGASEALVGRIHPQLVLPMTFLEYIRFKDEEADDGIAELVGSNYKKIQTALKIALTDNRAEEFFRVVNEEFKALLPYKDRILVHLNQYLIKGGYPEIANTSDMTVAAQHLRDYVHLTIYKDIVRTKKVRDPVALESLFAILAKGSSLIVNREELGKNLGLKRDTLNMYIYLLKTAFLISEVEYYSESRVKRARREKKIFINDSGIRNVSAAVFDEQTVADDNEMGRIVETVMGDHTRRLRSNLEATAFPSLFYWRETFEVDFIIDPFSKVLPVEVKYRHSIDESDLQGLRAFGRKFSPPLTLVITKDRISIQGSTVMIPAWLYLLMC